MNTKIFCTKYIGDYIEAHDVYLWSGKDVFISSPTGTGKNYFINNTLLPIVVSQGKKMLVLGNRVGLCYQDKLALLNKIVELTGDESVYNEFNKYNPNETSCLIHLSKFVDVCSYQYLIDNPILNTTDYLFVVVDECHFFLSDSRFNPYTDRILDSILNNTANHIFISATIEDIFSVIKAKNPNIVNNSIFYYNGYVNRNIQSITPLNTTTELAARINKGEKWVIFVMSKNTGISLNNQLRSKGINSIFLSREMIDDDYESKYKFNLLIREQSITNVTDVLICTSVLDNGINLYFHEDINIFIDSINRTQFLQMLGRIRGDVKIRLFYRVRNIEEITINIKDSLKEIYRLIYYNSIPSRLKERNFDNKCSYINHGLIRTNLLTIVSRIYDIDQLIDFYNIDLSVLINELGISNSKEVSKSNYIIHHTDSLDPYHNIIRLFFDRELSNPLSDILKEQSISDIRSKINKIRKGYNIQYHIDDNDSLASLNLLYSRLLKRGIKLSYDVDTVYKRAINPPNYSDVTTIQHYWVYNRIC